MLPTFFRFYKRLLVGLKIKGGSDPYEMANIMFVQSGSNFAQFPKITQWPKFKVSNWAVVKRRQQLGGGVKNWSKLLMDSTKKFRKKCRRHLKMVPFSINKKLEPNPLSRRFSKYFFQFTLSLSILSSQRMSRRSMIFSCLSLVRILTSLKVL